MTRTGFHPTLIALQTLLCKEIFRFMRIWSQTLLPPAIMMSLYFIVFGKFIGSQIQLIQTYAYIQYIAPGLVIMAIMTNAYTNTSSSFFFIKLSKSIEEMLISPMPTFIMLIGFMLGGIIRGMLVGILVILVALIFTHIPIQHPFIIISISILSAGVFSLGGLINGIFAKNFDDIGFIPTFIITPLTYLGGVFYSIQQLPPMWRTISQFNPIYNIVNAFRYGFLGVSDSPIYLGFLLIGTLFIILFFWAWILLNKGVGIKA